MKWNRAQPESEKSIYARSRTARATASTNTFHPFPDSDLQVSLVGECANLKKKKNLTEPPSRDSHNSNHFPLHGSHSRHDASIVALATRGPQESFSVHEVHKADTRSLVSARSVLGTGPGQRCDGPLAPLSVAAPHLKVRFVFGASKMTSWPRLGGLPAAPGSQGFLRAGRCLGDPVTSASVALVTVGAERARAAEPCARRSGPGAVGVVVGRVDDSAGAVAVGPVGCC